MVKRTVTLLALLWLVLASAVQADELRVEPDRTRLYEGEVLTLTVKGRMKIDINLGNLFDFNLSDLPSPDIEKVEPDFEILARNQRYSIQTINGDMVGEITWTYQLAPTRTGTLTIPPLTFKGATSKAIDIEVVPGAPADQGARPRDSFIELSADKAEVYVQEQLVLTVKLFFTGNLIRGELSEPEHPDAVVEALGKQREYTRYRDGIRYRVVERRYAVFPQKPGELELPPIRFEGQARTPEGALRFLRDSEEFFPIPVKPVPDSFSGDTWLPARNLTLEESGLPATPQVHAGDNLTRTLVLRADGLPAETLPPLPDQVPPGLRAYPDQPERDTEAGQDGLQGRLRQTIALVPVQAGDMTLPEIRIPWWDTDTDSEKVAVLDARTLSVIGSASSPEPAPATPQASPPKPEPAAEPATGPAVTDAPGADRNPWFWVSLILAAGWGLSVAGWWWQRGRGAPSESRGERDADGSERARYDQLILAARAASPDTPRLLLRWMRARYPGQRFRTVDDVAAFLGDHSLAAELARLEQARFGAQPDGHAYDHRALLAALERARRQRPAPTNGNDTALPPLYPDNLSP